MITYIMGYAKPEEILQFVHNHYFSRYINHHLTASILIYSWAFSNYYRRVNIMLIFLLYLSMISVCTGNFDGVKENSAW